MLAGARSHEEFPRGTGSHLSDEAASWLLRNGSPGERIATARLDGLYGQRWKATVKGWGYNRYG